MKVSNSFAFASPEPGPARAGGPLPQGTGHTHPDHNQRCITASLQPAEPCPDAACIFISMETPALQPKQPVLLSYFHSSILFLGRRTDKKKKSGQQNWFGKLEIIFSKFPCVAPLGCQRGVLSQISFSTSSCNSCKAERQCLPVTQQHTQRDRLCAEGGHVWGRQHFCLHSTRYLCP